MKFVNPFTTMILLIALLAAACLAPAWAAGGGMNSSPPGPATSNRLGLVQPDNTTISVGTTGILTAIRGASGISALTGDGTASGVGSVPFTLNTVNSAPGTFGDASHTATLTINGKGLVTVGTSQAIAIGTTNLTATGIPSASTYLRGDNTWATVTSGVSSVFGRTGAVTSMTGDYTTSQVTEGSNLYFTNARTIAAPLTGFSAAPGTVTSSDTILSAINKIVGNFGTGIINLVSQVTGILQAANGGTGASSFGCSITNNNGVLSTSQCSDDIVYTNATYPIPTSDAGRVIQYQGTGNVTMTLPPASTFGYTQGFAIAINNPTPYTVTLSIGGGNYCGNLLTPSSTCTIPAYTGCMYRSDNTNYPANLEACSAISSIQVPGVVGNALFNAGTGMLGASASLALGTNSISIVAPLNIGTTAFSDTGIATQETGSINSYFQHILQNTNAGSSASADYIAGGNDMTASAHYLDIGKNGSAGGIAPFVNADAAYTYTTDNELDFAALGASGTINFATGASPTTMMTIGTSGVGIGTATPHSTLQLGSGQIFVPSGTQGAPSYAFASDATTGLFLNAGGSLGLASGGNKFMDYYGGNIELNAPAQEGSQGIYLSSSSAGVTTPIYTFRDYTTTGIGGVPSSNALSLITAGTSRIYINSSGSVGVGTTNPAAKLDVYSGVALGAIDIGGYNGISFPADNQAGGTVAIGAGTVAVGTTSATYDNTAIGFQVMAGTMTTAAGLNVGIGEQALNALMSGNSNVAVGQHALFSDLSGSYNTAVGQGALSGVTSAPGNVAVGQSTMTNLTTGTGVDTAIGNGAGNSISTGYYETAVGGSAMGQSSALTGGGNTAIGQYSLSHINGSAASNVGIGYAAGGNITTGSNNVAIGNLVGNSTLTTGSNNILIGTNSGVDTQTSSASNTLNIGNLIYGTGLASSGTTSAGSVGIGTSSPSDLLDVNGGNVGLLQPTAATSGTPQQFSPNLIMNSQIWNGSSSVIGALTINYAASQPNTVSNYKIGVLNFSMPAASGVSTNQVNTEVLFNSYNTYISAENLNDSAGSVFGESYNSALFGMQNYNGSTYGIIPSGQSYAFLGMNNNGVVGTLQQRVFPESSAPAFRNVLDDGTSAANVGIGTTTPLSKLDVRGPIKTYGYTVSTLPTGSIGMIAYVTDATTCTFLGSLTGGGSTFCPVIYNGTAWVAE